jgi:hypothetical protein
MCVIWTVLCRWHGQPKNIIFHLDINNCSRVLPALRAKQSFPTHQCKCTASCVGCCAWRSRNTRHSSTLRSVYRNSCPHTLDTAQEPAECDLNTTGDLLRLGPRWRPFVFHVWAANGCSPGFQLRSQSTQKELTAPYLTTYVFQALSPLDYTKIMDPIKKFSVVRIKVPSKSSSGRKNVPYLAYFY